MKDVIEFIVNQILWLTEDKRTTIPALMVLVLFVICIIAILFGG